MHKYICKCRDCKRMARKGLILGTRIARHFKDGWTSDGMAGPYSAYVPYHRWQKGRRPEVIDK